MRKNFLRNLSFSAGMKYFKDIKTVQLPEEIIQKAKNFAEKVTPTTDYSDSNQHIRKKVLNDHFISKLGEEAAKLVFSMYAEVKGPDYNIYAAENKSWSSDLFVNGVGLAVKTQKRSMANRYKLSWTFQHGKMRKDKIFDSKESWITFVEYDDTGSKNLCHVYPPFQLKELIFGEPALTYLKGEKKVIYAGTLKIG